MKPPHSSYFTSLKCVIEGLERPVLTLEDIVIALAEEKKNIPLPYLFVDVEDIEVVKALVRGKENKFYVLNLKNGNLVEYNLSVNCEIIQLEGLLKLNLKA